MITVFEKIPELFVQIYDPQFQVWAREFRTRGRKCAIVFNLAPGADPPVDGEGRIIAAGCWLEAQIEAGVGEPRIVIKPASEHDAEMIARHCHEMKAHVLQ
jgi:hypothetical protein